MMGPKDPVFTVECIYVLLLDEFAEIASFIVSISMVTPSISLSQAAILFF